MSIMAYFCISGACSPQDFGMEGDRAPLVGKAPGRAYGATGTVELQSGMGGGGGSAAAAGGSTAVAGATARRMLDARMM